MSVNQRGRNAACIIVGAYLALVAFCASAAPFVQPLHYSTSSGYAVTGSVTFDDAIWTPNNYIYGLYGLIAVDLTLSGPGVPGGTTFHLADLESWTFKTNSQNKIVDLNFFMVSAPTGCYVNGVEVFLLGIYCSDAHVATLQLQNYITPPVQVPTLDTLALALLATLVAGLGLARVRRQGVSAHR